MNIKTRGEVKRISACELGDFVKVKIDSSLFCGFIISDLPNDEVKTIIAFDGEKASMPFPKHIDYDDICVSFGSDYVLEADIDLNPWKNIDSAGLPGTIALGHDSKGLVFSQDGKSRALKGIFDLNSLRAIQRDPTRAVIVTQWRIWASDEDRRMPDVEPVFEFRLRPFVDIK